MIKKKLNINGVCWNLGVEPTVSLAVLFQNRPLEISLDGGRCGTGDCADCFVIINGEAVLPCATFLGELPDGTFITTREGIKEAGALQALQLSWVVHRSPGCFCCSGKAIRIGTAMLGINPFPSRKDIESWFLQQPFKCCNSKRTMQKRIDAIEDAARVVRGEIGINELACKISTEKRVLDLRQFAQDCLIVGSAPWTPVPELGIKIPPDTLHLALVRAGVSNAELVSIEAGEAWSVPGVYRVITYHDVLGSNYLSSPAFAQGEGLEFNRPILSICREEIKNKYEVLAVVCADSLQNALAAARKVKAKYKFSRMEGASAIQTRTQNRKTVTGPIYLSQAYNLGFANLVNNGKLVIHSRFSFPDHYRSIIAWAIGLNEQQLDLVHSNGAVEVSQGFNPFAEAILGQAFLSTGRPVFLKCSNYTCEKFGSVTAQWSTK
jgi:aldehyde oxidoreductase